NTRDDPRCGRVPSGTVDRRTGRPTGRLCRSHRLERGRLRRVSDNRVRPSPRASLLRPPSSRHQAFAVEALLVVAAFVGVAVFATWPLTIHPLGGFYGFGNDNWGGMPYLAWLHHAYLGSGTPSFDPQLQAPFGFEIPLHAIQPIDRLFALVFG